jgi:predicted enzyme related to lactoylglutathione lyase
MALIEKHAPGSFCWVELGTTDQNAAKSFYAGVFGWNANDMPMGPGDYYTIFKLEGADVAAGYTLRPDKQKQGVPPHWMLYIAVENADEIAERAGGAGAKVLASPFDVFTFGRMAVLQDPTGALFSVWQPKSHKGTGIKGVDGTLCWADLATPDPERATRFYTEVFGWKVAPGEHDSSGYLHIQNGEEFIGGIPPAKYRDPNTPPHWLLYFLTSNCDGTAAKARELGARFHLEPTTMENVGRMAVVADPQGAAFAIFQPRPR